MTKVASKPALKTKREVIYKLKPSRLQAGMEGNRMRWWSAHIEEGTPYEELFNPVFWDVHGYRFEPGDMIRAEPDEQHYTADLKVRAKGVGGVRVEEYYKKEWDVTEPAKNEADDYRVRYAGPHHKWRIERIDYNHVENSGFDNEAAARRWLADNLKALSKAAIKAKEAA